MTNFIPVVLLHFIPYVLNTANQVLSPKWCIICLKNKCLSYENIHFGCCFFIASNIVLRTRCAAVNFIDVRHRKYIAKYTFFDSLLFYPFLSLHKKRSLFISTNMTRPLSTAFRDFHTDFVRESQFGQFDRAIGCRSLFNET